MIHCNEFPLDDCNGPDVLIAKRTTVQPEMDKLHQQHPPSILRPPAAGIPRRCHPSLRGPHRQGPQDHPLGVQLLLQGNIRGVHGETPPHNTQRGAVRRFEAAHRVHVQGGGEGAGCRCGAPAAARGDAAGQGAVHREGEVGGAVATGN